MAFHSLICKYTHTGNGFSATTLALPLLWSFKKKFFNVETNFSYDLLQAASPLDQTSPSQQTARKISTDLFMGTRGPRPSVGLSISGGALVMDGAFRVGIGRLSINLPVSDTKTGHEPCWSAG